MAKMYLSAFLYSLVLLSLTSCLSFTAIHEFSQEALEGTAEFDKLEMNFQQLCRRKNIMNAVRTTDIRRNYDSGCQLQLMADSAMQTMHQAIVDYLEALHQVTANQRAAYVLEPVSGALQNTQLVQIQPEQLSAYQKLTELLLEASTETFRKKKVTAFIAKANEPLQILTDKLVFVMENSLKEAIVQQQEMVYTHTKELADSAQSFLEKKDLILAQAESQAMYTQQIKWVDAYVAILQQVKDGHQQLYDIREQLNKEDAIASLVHYTGKIRQLQSDFEKIK